MTQEILVNGEPIAYDRCPVDYMADGFKMYFERGILPGDFGTALLENNLMEACGRADDNNRRAIFQWCEWLYNYAPGGSFGSVERVANYIKSRQSEAA
jgi:hypothetical protein